MEIYHVDPAEVRCRASRASTDKFQVSERDWKAQAARLLIEGQIEPIEVVKHEEDESLFKFRIREDAWHYAEAQVIAAIELEWPTILVTY
jgi:hypothetical protein